MFYVLDISDDYPDSLWCTYLYEQSPPPSEFSQTKTITPPQPLPSFKFKKNVSQKKVLEYDFFNSSVDLISPRFARLLEEIAPNDIQLIDAAVWIDEKKIEGFKVMNILHSISCIDLKKSETYHMLPNDPSSPMVISTPVFRDGTLTEYMIARAAEDKAKTIVVAESFMNACKNAGIRGIEFRPEGRLQIT